jgi:RNA polymerase sigma-70 factor, ECF subfamily
MAESDAVLLDRCPTGDRMAYTTLVKRYQSLALSQAFSHVQNRNDALDLARAAFLDLYRQLPSGGEAYTFPIALLRRIDEMANDRRKRRSRAGDSMTPPTQEERNLVILGREVASLPEADRIAITLKHQSALSDAEISEAVGESAGSVGARVARALKILRETIVRKLNEGELAGEV